jgi:hypothetical protein
VSESVAPVVGAEIAALRAIAAALDPLTEDECRRILGWAFERFVDDPATARAEAASEARRRKFRPDLYPEADVDPYEVLDEGDFSVLSTESALQRTTPESVGGPPTGEQP